MSRIASALLGGVALVAVGAAPSLAQSPFDGAYVGAFTGYTDNNASAASGATRADIDSDGWLYGAYAGYGKTFDQFYFGAEAEIGSASLSDKGLTLRGLTCRELIKKEVETSAAAARAAGVPVDVAIGLRETGCTRDPPNACQRDLDALTRENKVLFGQGTSVVTLDAVTEQTIEAAHGILQQCPQSRITIEGHANDDGEARGFDNLGLSIRRAQRVRDELVERGVDAGQLAVQGYGAKRPLVPHGGREARVMNRRVQFTVVK